MQVNINQVSENPGVLIGSNPWTKNPLDTCNALEQWLHQTTFFGQSDYEALVTLRRKLKSYQPSGFRSNTKRERIEAVTKKVNDRIRVAHPLFGRAPDDAIRHIFHFALCSIKDFQNFSRVNHHFCQLMRSSPDLIARIANENQLLNYCERYEVKTLTISADESRLIQVEASGRVDVFSMVSFHDNISSLTFVGSKVRVTHLRYCRLGGMSKLSQLTLVNICLTKTTVEEIKKIKALKRLTLDRCSYSKDDNANTEALNVGIHLKSLCSYTHIEIK